VRRLARRQTWQVLQKLRPGVPAGADSVAPWFARSPRLALLVAALLYVGVFVLRVSIDDPSEVITAFYVLPIALVTVTYGLRGGLVGSLLALLLVAVWAVAEDVDLSVFGWVTRAVPLLGMGLLLGHAWERLREAAELRRQDEVAAVQHRQAVEINDSLIQGMAAARWTIEAGQVERGLDMLDDTLRLGQQLVSGLIKDSGLGPTQGRGPGA
jgi:glucose-6-phosphate-specific signal transduction histidine kinase